MLSNRNQIVPSRVDYYRTRGTVPDVIAGKGFSLPLERDTVPARTDYNMPA